MKDINDSKEMILNICGFFDYKFERGGAVLGGGVLIINCYHGMGFILIPPSLYFFKYIGESDLKLNRL